VNPFGGANPIGQLGALTVLNGDASRGSDIPISAGHPPLESYSTRDATGRLNMFKGKRVVYKEGQAGVQNRDGSWSKIWFPEGAPAYYKDTEMEDSAYDESTKEAYVKMRQAGSFQGGVMPLVPPKREWCLWNF
jgi:nucleoporin NUP42